MEKHIRVALKEKGPEGIEFFYLWSIHATLCCIKMMKAGFRLNAFDPNARHCMAAQ